MPCPGCIDLDNGTGGENQLAHMDLGGCLYNEEEGLLGIESTPVLDLLTPEQLEKIKKILEHRFSKKHILSYRKEFETLYRLADLFIKDCKNHNYEKMRQTLAEGYPIDSRVDITNEFANGPHFCALHCAVIDNDTQLVCWLLQYGASFSVESYYKCGYVDEFIESDQIQQIYNSSNRINYCTRSFDSFKYCLENGKISLDKNIFAACSFISEEDYEKANYMELLEQVFEYVREDYKMGLYFHKEYNLTKEFQQIREYVSKKVYLKTY